MKSISKSIGYICIAAMTVAALIVTKDLGSIFFGVFGFAVFAIITKGE